MRAIGAFFFVMLGCPVTPYGRPCVTVRVGPSQPLQSASLHWQTGEQISCMTGCLTVKNWQLGAEVG